MPAAGGGMSTISSISAMSPVVACLLLLAGLVPLVGALVRTVHPDGYGHRPPPASHRAWRDVS